MIQVQNLNKTYDRRQRNANQVLHDVSFSLPDKGFICILGPSGCGKTSLLNALGGLDSFDSGTITTGSLSINRYGTAAYEAERNRDFGYIFQNYYLLSDHTAAYNVYLGLHSLELSHKEKLRRVRMALKAVDMERYIRRKVGTLSGGQQQRIAIARALARRPKVIFADEPTGNLDEANTRNICTLLRQASRDSLVIMVTHEERIARFYADRILTLRDGRLASDSDAWERGNLENASDAVLYTGDFQEESLEGSQVSLRLLREADAAPVSLTVVAMKDRVILKLSDSRAVTLSSGSQPPQLLEGRRPVLTLETIDREAGSQSQLFQEPSARQCRAGAGVSMSMMLQEARQLMRGKGLRRVGMRMFLILLTALTMLTVADFLALSKVDPLSFVNTDSHILSIQLDSGPNLQEGLPPVGNYTYLEYNRKQYVQRMLDSGLDFDLIPTITQTPSYSLPLFYQMDKLDLSMLRFSYVYIDRLPENSLIYGGMPLRSDEVVVDRLVLERMLQNDGIIQNSVVDLSHFVGETMRISKKGLNITVAGICDTGEYSLFVRESMLDTISSSRLSVITLSELQAQYPGEYDELTLEPGTCAVNTAREGTSWANRMGQDFRINSKLSFSVAGALDLPDIQNAVVIADDDLSAVTQQSFTQNFTVYCADKAAVKAFLAEPSEWEQDGYLSVTVTDPYQQAYDSYARAARLRADGRTIITATVLVLSMVMLGLLCRAQAQSRMELMAVYRLLGIPRGKLYGIFTLEGTLSALGTIIPTGILVALLIHFSTYLEALNLPVELPWPAALLVGLGILGYYLLVSLLPLVSLLHQPPARLAAKYDL